MNVEQFAQNLFSLQDITHAIDDSSIFTLYETPTKKSLPKWSTTTSSTIKKQKKMKQPPKMDTATIQNIFNDSTTQHEITSQTTFIDFLDQQQSSLDAMLDLM